MANLWQSAAFMYVERSTWAGNLDIKCLNTSPPPPHWDAPNCRQGQHKSGETVAYWRTDDRARLLDKVKRGEGIGVDLPTSLSVVHNGGQYRIDIFIIKCYE